MTLLAYVLSAVAAVALALLWITAPLWSRRDPDAALDAQADQDADHAEFPW